MFKKISLAAALLCCAAISPAAYADGFPSAIGNAVNGAVNAGEDIMNGAENATRDILNGFTADDTNPGAGIGGSGRTTNYNTGGTSDSTSGNTTSGSTSGNTSDSTSDSSDDISSGSNSSNAAGGNPDTGISMGYVASAAVLAAMGVVVTAVKRRDD